jgi:hypothetical protein
VKRTTLECTAEPTRARFQNAVKSLRGWARQNGGDETLEALRMLESYSGLEDIPPSESGKRPLRREETLGSGEMAVQLEKPGSLKGRSRFVVFNIREFSEYVSAFAGALAEIGVRKGSRLALLDYSTGLPVLASSLFYNGLGVEGISERMGVVTICCDGLPELTPRSVYVVGHFRPDYAIVRSDLLEIFQTTSKRVRGAGEKARAPRLVVTYDEFDPSPMRLGGGPNMRVMPRADAALFCSVVSDGRLYYDPSTFLLEVVENAKGSQAMEGEPGYLCVTNLAIPTRRRLRYVTNLEATLRKNKIVVQA